jgi:hypothetical protein
MGRSSHDKGVFGGLTPSSCFVIMGDQNADPFEGDSRDNAIHQLLDNPLVNTSFTPKTSSIYTKRVIRLEVRLEPCDW